MLWRDMAADESSREERHLVQGRGTRHTLWFEQFRDIAVMAVALSGGIITLLGTVFSGIRVRGSVVIALGLLIGAAVSALIGQTHVVDLSDRGVDPDARAHKLRKVAFALLAAGCGAFLAFALMSFVRMAQTAKP
jgi:hypothetical protein